MTRKKEGALRNDKGKKWLPAMTMEKGGLTMTADFCNYSQNQRLSHATRNGKTT